MQSDTQNPHELIRYYQGFNEQERLSDAWGQLEFVRTMDILTRYLPEPPARILDVGGAAGRYSLWLARQGYNVSLIDPVPRHIEQAQEASANQSDLTTGRRMPEESFCWKSCGRSSRKGA
jgi:2-polyprenyl-3-methyl-5-hydroxy-6-metoxy-1,4-benzoquinol methylase